MLKPRRQLFRPNDPRLVNYREDKKLFGGAETGIVAYTDPELLTLAGLERLERFDSRLRLALLLLVKPAAMLSGAVIILMGFVLVAIARVSGSVTAQNR